MVMNLGRALIALFCDCAGEHLLPGGREVRGAEHGGGRRVKSSCLGRRWYPAFWLSVVV